MPRKKRRPTKKGVPIRVKLFVASLVLVLAAGIGSVKLFQTTRGKIILLDAGFTEYYSLVQQELDAELRRSLESFGLDRSLKQGVQRIRIGKAEYDVRHWEASCRGPCSPAKIALAFTKAAKKKGAVARSRLESPKGDSPSGDTIVITVGSRRFATHEITIEQPAISPRQSRQPAKPQLALVIDDFGYSKSAIIESFLAIDLPLTIAVLPSLPRSRYVLERARATGKETILHLPMEAESTRHKGAAIATSMSDLSIRQLVESYLKESAGIAGVNNHQGSLATRDRRVMLVVMSIIKNHGLYFLDSLTSSESIAYNTAKSLEVPAAKNHLFLDDNTEDPVVVGDRLLRLVALAKQRGHAVGIGHPKPWTFEAITKNEKLLKESGVELVFVSELTE